MRKLDGGARISCGRRYLRVNPIADDAPFTALKSWPGRTTAHGEHDVVERKPGMTLLASGETNERAFATKMLPRREFFLFRRHPLEALHQAALTFAPEAFPALGWSFASPAVQFFLNVLSHSAAMTFTTLTSRSCSAAHPE